jgi:hypothetical protein
LSDALRKVNARLKEACLTEIVVNESVLAVFAVPDAGGALLAPAERLGDHARSP